MTGTIDTLREVWRRIDRVERVCSDQANKSTGARQYSDADFNRGQISGCRMCKEVLRQVAREIGAQSGVPTVERAVAPGGAK